MASPLRPDPPEHHRPSHAADFARGDSLDRPVGRLPGPHQRWGTRRANPLAGLAPTGGCGWDVALVASGFLCVYLWVMISVPTGPWAVSTSMAMIPRFGRQNSLGLDLAVG